MIFSYFRFFMICLMACSFCLSSANASIATNTLERENSLGLSLAKRMVNLRQTRPLPSLGYQLSSRLVKQQKESLKLASAKPAPNKKNSRAPKSISKFKSSSL
jgi:hypothetical protein